MAAPDKIANSVARSANRKGKWNISSFNYNSWLKMSDRLISSNAEEAYMIKALTYFMNGELPNFLEYATKLFDEVKNFNTFNIYLAAVHVNGQLENTTSLFDEYIDELSNADNYRLLLANHLTYARYALDNSTLEKNYEKFKKRLDADTKGFILETIELNKRDLSILNFAGIDKALFLEVMGVAIQTLGEVGNFVTGYGIHARRPNDDLTLSIHAQEIDIELMHELNEAWLNKIVDHESTYDFEQLSRVLVNFQPGVSESKEEYVS